jgi:hypothetical protein
MFLRLCICRTTAVLIASLVATAAFAKPGENCFNGVGNVERNISGYTVRIEPVLGDEDEHMCRAVVRASDGREL